ALDLHHPLDRAGRPRRDQHVRETDQGAAEEHQHHDDGGTLIRLPYVLIAPGTASAVQRGGEGQGAPAYPDRAGRVGRTVAVATSTYGRRMKVPPRSGSATTMAAP